MRHTLLLSFALFTVAIGCGRQTTATNSPPEIKTMNSAMELDVCGDKKIQNPTEADIRQAVFGLDTKKGEAFLVLGPTDMTYIQTSGDQKVGFDLEYQQTDANHHYRAKRDLTADEVIKALTSYCIGSDDWKKATEWEHIKW
jgi:hypothetical protein